MAAQSPPSTLAAQTAVLALPRIQAFVVDAFMLKLGVIAMFDRLGMIERVEFPTWLKQPVSVREHTAMHPIQGIGFHNIPLSTESTDTAEAVFAPAHVVVNWSVTVEEEAQLGSNPESRVRLATRRKAQATNLAMRGLESHLLAGTAWGASSRNVWAEAGFNSLDANVSGVTGLLQGATVSAQTGSVGALARGTGLFQGSAAAAAPFDWFGQWNNVFRDLDSAFVTNIQSSLRSAMEEIEIQQIEDLPSSERKLILLATANKLLFQTTLTTNERWDSVQKASNSIANGATVPVWGGKHPIVGHPRIRTGAADTDCGAMILDPACIKLRTDQKLWGMAPVPDVVLPGTIIKSGMLSFRGQLRAISLRTSAWLGDPS